jgi:hypothetical protein
VLSAGVFGLPLCVLFWLHLGAGTELLRHRLGPAQEKKTSLNEEDLKYRLLYSSSILLPYFCAFLKGTTQ